MQIKSGPSHWRRRDGNRVLFTPEAKHRAYWARHPLPVVVILHEEDSEATIWVDARAQRRAGETTIRILLRNVLDADADGVRRALASDGALLNERRSPTRIVREMAANRHPESGVQA